MRREKANTNEKTEYQMSHVVEQFFFLVSNTNGRLGRYSAPAQAHKGHGPVSFHMMER